MESLTFDLSEFQVLEDIEFDETIQRPEQIRFFTLQEQTVDAFERLIPRGRVTKYQLKQIQRKVERFEDLYTNFVVPTAEKYQLREPSYSKRFDWISPIYASPDLKEYSFKESWIPLFTNVTLPNYYPRMLSALPKPYAGIGTGQPYPVAETTEFVDDTGNKPLRVLPIYSLSKTQVHEDKTISVVSVPVQGTADELNFKGYYLAKRDVDVPNPLPDHPFLKGNEATVLDSTSPLEEVVPSLDAILTHAVPVTQDPYGEGMKYLKVYDIQLSDIPWSSWRSKFPQVEAITVTPQPEEIPYPKVESNAPSEKLETIYNSKYAPGLSARYWLMNQIDGGELVIEMLKSESINNGSVEVVPLVDMLPSNYPTTTLDDPACNLSGTSFAEFVTKGLLRKDDNGNYTCVPLEFIKQERSQLGYKNRKPWKETTGSDILKEHLLALKSFAYPEIEAKIKNEPKTGAKEESPIRIQVLAIEEDVHRLKEDKVKDIQELLKDTFLTNNIYKDSEERFVCCAHTLALLSDELDYDTWTTREGGFRVCKFCGEQINSDVFVNQEEFDENGFKIVHSDSFAENTVSTDTIQSYVTGLRILKPLFDLEAVMDSTVFLMTSILQILPDAGTLDSLLKVCRGFIAKKIPKKSDNVQFNELKGVIGIACICLLLQIHIPMLLPRRSFGSQPLKLSGFPRDDENTEGYTIVDSMLFVLRRTFEAYPTSFKGPAAPIVRAVLDNEKRKKIRKQVIVFIGELKKQDNIEAELMKSADHVKSQPIVEQPKALLPVVQPPKELGILTGFPTCPSERPILASANPPKVVQQEPPLLSGLHSAKGKTFVEPSISVREQVKPADAKQVTAQLKKKPKNAPVQKGYVTNLMLASHIADERHIEIPVRNVDTTQKADVLRDVAQGLLFEATPTTEVKKDVTIYTLTANYKDQKKEVNRLKAKERLTLVERLRTKNDQEREDLGELLRIGLAPYIITNEDRVLFAQEAQQIDEEEEMDEEIGVGQPHDFQDQGEGEADVGNYGDYFALPTTDGRDQDQQYYGEDDEMPI